MSATAAHAAPASSLPPVRLILFGDSWVRAHTEVTWPELLGELLGWPTINVALPGSHSGTLALQYELLQRVLAAQGRTVHPEAWALVHAGGNDILHSSPDQILALVAKLLCCGPCLPCGAVKSLASLDGALHNVQQLTTRLRDHYGIRNVILCGLPLSVHMPLVSRYLQLLLGVGKAVTCLGGVAVQRLNWLWLRRLESLGPAMGLRVVTLDEADAIERIVTGLTPLGMAGGDAGAGSGGGGGRGGSGGGGGGGDEESCSGASDEADAADGSSAPGSSDGGGRRGGGGGKEGGGSGPERSALLRGHRSGSERPPPDYSSDADAAGGEGGSGAPSPPLPGEDGDEDGLWADMLHPSQRFHTELSVAMLATFNRARGLD